MGAHLTDALDHRQVVGDEHSASTISAYTAEFDSASTGISFLDTDAIIYQIEGEEPFAYRVRTVGRPAFLMLPK